MELTHIRTLTARLVLETGLHIGAGDSEMHIGGVDKQVVKHPITHLPYIPGSSLKGKMRSLLEWKSGAVQENPLGLGDFDRANGAQQEQIAAIVKLFGISGDARLNEAQACAIGPSRLAFWDCELAEDWRQQVEAANQPFVEVKSENSINRISGVAIAPRFFERVPAGAAFDFRLSLKVIDDENLLPTVLVGLRLIELDSLGGSGSRGYGKVRFADLKLDGEPIELPQDPFAA
ncbi:MAG: type III-A CRISPR-associated RAMP protein Csm3 [Sideroxydans sp.]